MESELLNVLVALPDPRAATALEAALKQRGHDVLLYSPPIDGAFPDGTPADAAFIDVLCGAPEIERAAQLNLHVVVMGERGSSTDPVQALRAGASDFLPRDFRAAELEAALALAKDRAGGASAFLELIDRGGEARQVGLRGKQLTIGRDSTNDLWFDSPIVSRFHARIVHEKLSYSIHDCGSRHGTFVDDVRIAEKTLEDGTLIRLGTTGGLRP